MDTQPVTPSAPAIPEPSRPVKHQRTSAFNALQTIISAAIVLATLFTLWTPANLFSNDLLDKMFLALQPGGEQQVPAGDWPTPTPLPAPRIGIVSGHWGNDSGTVCSDGLTEEQVNLRIAAQVEKNLKAAGYDVDLLQEKDARLSQYQATVLVSIHNDSCDYINNEATGYKVAAAMSTSYPEKAARLTACLTQRYAEITGMRFHFNTITPDMTSYHAFDEINSNTTAAIIETGFLNLDRDMLVNHYETVAEGVSAGILCYIRNENIPNVLPTDAIIPTEPAP
ncbi:MAG TPA: N-acetylmuramoyl-L-alanine amidase [Anaerolineaceae bacterium]